MTSLSETAKTGALIGLICLLCNAQGVPKPAPSPVQVHRGKSEMDGEHWTILGVWARESYRNSFGTAMRPELALQCIQTGDDREITLILDSGPIEEGYGGAWLRARLDGGDALWYSWVQYSDHKSYWYSKQARSGDNRNGDDLPDEKADLVRALLSAKTFLIEFRPFMSASATVARFNLSGLRREFDKAPECKLPSAVVE